MRQKACTRIGKALLTLGETTALGKIIAACDHAGQQDLFQNVRVAHEASHDFMAAMSMLRGPAQALAATEALEKSHFCLHDWVDPTLEIRVINAKKGRGVFATAPLPKGICVCLIITVCFTFISKRGFGGQLKNRHQTEVLHRLCIIIDCIVIV